MDNSADKFIAEADERPAHADTYTAWITDEPNADPNVRYVEEIDVWATSADQARRHATAVMAAWYDPGYVIIHLERRFGLFF
jgi:hypothetical protein